VRSGPPAALGFALDAESPNQAAHHHCTMLPISIYCPDHKAALERFGRALTGKSRTPRRADL
jgi:hypothetical protein